MRCTHELVEAESARQPVITFLVFAAQGRHTVVGILDIDIPLQVSDEGAILALVDQVIEQNPAQVQQFKEGKTAVLQYLVPVLIMHNSDEGAVMLDSVSADEFNQQLSQLPAQWADSVKAYYPSTTAEERLFSLRDLVRDINFGWGAYAWETLQSKTGKSPVYAAYLAQKSDRTVYAKGNRRGAAHADDILYLKGGFDDAPDQYPQEKKVSDLMQQYWVNFAKTGGDPNGEGLPKWPVFDAQGETVMQFKDGAGLIGVPNRARIELIDRFFSSIRK